MDRTIIQIIGYSGSGKTTFISKLIKYLADKGKKVAAVKHDVHGLDIDREGKDSYIFSESGAAVSVVSSPEMAVFKIHKELSLDEILSNIKDVDIIIVEGYTGSGEHDNRRGERLPEPATRKLTIGLARQSTGKGFKGDITNYDILVTDIPESEIRQLGYQNKILGLDDIEEISKIVELLK